MDIIFSNTFAAGEHSWDPYTLEVNESRGMEGEGQDEAVEEEENIEVIRTVRTEDSGYDDCGVPNISLENIKVDNIDSVEQEDDGININKLENTATKEDKIDYDDLEGENEVIEMSDDDDDYEQIFLQHELDKRRMLLFVTLGATLCIQYCTKKTLEFPQHISGKRVNPVDISRTHSYAAVGEETVSVEDPSWSSEDVEYDDEADDSVLTDSF
ncbi:hypothetical protein Cgig2_017814 [Carnegiea gigantea]|uniref:Uncharacterized protein n=1 Tax=Carnegiea gigantea TaxID=171969 RepID=A0A9Q1QQE2_9CARY|nr:hypothetical protein Cgig2_017814 [Carnegiea gigantea]